MSLPDGYWEAGRDYLAALTKLGMRPSGVLWAWDRTVEEWVLVLVTEQLDTAGPSELFRLLTRAHNLAATPSEISPFIIRLQSWSQPATRGVLQAIAVLRSDLKTMLKNEGELTDWRDEVHDPQAEIGDLYLDPHWVYLLEERKPKPVERQREWRRFRQNVEALAA